MIKLANLAAQTDEIWLELEPKVRDIVRNSRFIGGIEVQEFEREFARFVGASECIGVGNGSDSLEIALEALGICEGDEVIVPALSYAATSESVLRVGAKPVFVDVGEDLLINPQLIKERVTSRTRAVIPVHLYGNPFNVHKHLSDEIADGIAIVEDAAQAHGARVNGVVAGAMGHIGSFSFYPGKNLGAWGDAGAITTTDLDLAQRIRRLSNHGRLSKFDHEIAGRNSRLDSIQAAVLSAKLIRLNEWTERRRANANLYLEALGELEWLQLPLVDPNAYHVWHQFVVRVPDRDAFRSHLRSLNIETGVHYPYALPDLPFHVNHKMKTEVPIARRAASCVVSLPVSEHLSDSDIQSVIESIMSLSSP
jgi:dTDP-4-amino-4,6-dideoxygalactose transaminase